jgi:regulator of protease activity HflC (stomatin/prohibitin superfamily)
MGKGRDHASRSASLSIEEAQQVSPSYGDLSNIDEVASPTSPQPAGRTAGAGLSPGAATQSQSVDNSLDSATYWDEDIRVSPGHIGAFVIILVGAAIASATIAESFHYVQYNEYALVRDTYGGVDLNHVYSEGRYAFPLTKDMILFPSSYNAVQFEVTVFTDTGLEFDVGVNFYYRLPKNNISRIYNDFSMSYDDLVTSNAKVTIKNNAVKFGLSDYFTNRTLIEDVFANEVSKVLNAIVHVEVPTRLFKIYNVDLPDSVIESSLESATALQQNDLLALSQQVTVIREETKRLVAIRDAETSQLLSFASNEAQRIVDNSKSYYNQIEIRARAEGLKTVLDVVPGTNATQSMEIVRLLALIDNTLNMTLVDVPGIQLQV